MINAMEGLDEETKREKIMELRRLREAKLVDDDDEVKDDPKKKMENYDYKNQKLGVQNDFIDMAVKISSKLKSEKKNKHFLAFLKKVNMMISKDFDSDLHRELVDSLSVIKNKKAKEKKTANNEKTTKTVVNKSNQMTDIGVEVDPNYKPRNHQMYDDFM
jgi:hypothetical protein